MSAKSRELNFELLRIVSMIMIFLHHYVLHGCSEYALPYFTSVLMKVIEFGGKIGVDLFVMVTGYFLINSKFKIQKVLKLCIQVSTYCFILVCFMSAFSKIPLIYMLRLYWKNVLLCVNLPQYGFFGTYIGLYFIFPFINKCIKTLSKKNLQTIIIIMFFLLSFIPSIFTDSSLVWGNISWFAFLYVLGAYIKLYNIKIFEENKDCFVYATLIYVFIALIRLGFDNIFSILSNLNHIFYDMNSFIILAESIVIFYGFKNLKIEKSSNCILLFSQAAFPMYLIHDNGYFRIIYWNLTQIGEYVNAKLYVIIAHIVFTLLVTYMIAVCTEYIRLKGEKLIFKHLNNSKFLKKIDKAFDI